MTRPRTNNYLIALLLALAVLQACASSEDQIGSAQEVFQSARQSHADLDSYSAQFSTGFAADTLFTAEERFEFFGTGEIMSRFADGTVNFVAVDRTINRPLNYGAWCRVVEDGADLEDVISTIPESLDRFLTVGTLDDDLIAVEGMVVDDTIPTNDGRSVVMVHRFVIDTTRSHFVEWTQWPGSDTDADVVHTALASELLSDLESTKAGPWNRIQFSDFGELDPVTVPPGIDTECPALP